jgi:hypothetical protein
MAEAPKPDNTPRLGGLSPVVLTGEEAGLSWERTGQTLRDYIEEKLKTTVVNIEGDKTKQWLRPDTVPDMTAWRDLFKSPAWSSVNKLGQTELYREVEQFWENYLFQDREELLQMSSQDLITSTEIDYLADRINVARFCKLDEAFPQRQFYTEALTLGRQIAEKYFRRRITQFFEQISSTDPLLEERVRNLHGELVRAEGSLVLDPQVGLQLADMLSRPAWPQQEEYEVGASPTPSLSETLTEIRGAFATRGAAALWLERYNQRARERRRVWESETRRRRRDEYR